MDAETLAAAVRADRRASRILADYAATVPDRERLAAYVRHVVANTARTMAARRGEPPPDRETMLDAADRVSRAMGR